MVWELCGFRPSPPALGNLASFRELSKQVLGTGLPLQDPLNSHDQGHNVYLDAVQVPEMQCLKVMGFRIHSLCKVNRAVSQGTQETLPAVRSEVLLLEED